MCLEFVRERPDGVVGSCVTQHPAQGSRAGMLRPGSLVGATRAKRHLQPGLCWGASYLMVGCAALATITACWDSAQLVEKTATLNNWIGFTA